MSERVNATGLGAQRPLRHAAEIATAHLRVTAQNELQYRANFGFQLLQTAWQLMYGLVVVALVYSKTPELNGWRQAELLAAIGVFTIIGGLLRSVVFPPLRQLTEDVADGSFDFTLTRPADAQLLVSVRQIDFWQLADVVAGAVIVAITVPRLPSGFSALDVVWFIVLLATGAVIIYCMWLALACIAFWVTRLPFMYNLMHYTTRAAQYPITIYPMWLRVSMTVLVPMGIAVTAPAEAIASRLSWVTAVSALAVAVVLAAFSRWLWRRALARYSGASG